MEKFKNKLIGFMRGRYGVDLLSRSLLVFAIILSIVAIFVDFKWLQLVNLFLLVLVIYRMFSKKIYKRAGENEKFLSLIYPFRKFGAKIKNRFKTRKEFKYFKCSECKKDLRVPKNKGKIVVTCPKCGHKMKIKS